LSQSAIYEGRLRHRRRTPKQHEFTYPLYMVYLDLEEADVVLGASWLTSAKGGALFAFRRKDYLGDPAQDLATSVRDLVEEKLGARPLGPIRLLANLACLGTNFNPVAFYYCFAEDGETLAAVVADIVNTPWGERHSYVLACAKADEHRGDTFSFQLEKEFHVSPFFPMTQQYAWKFLQPGRHLLVHMENFEHSAKVFDATLTLERRSDLSPRTLLACQLRHPLMGLRILYWIYRQAAQLFLRKIPFIPHPSRAAAKKLKAGAEVLEDL